VLSERWKSSEVFCHNVSLCVIQKIEMTTYSVNFAMSYRSAVGSTPLISDLEHSVAIVQKISWICWIIISHSSLLDLTAYIYLLQQGTFD
jgi:hypothetical protein